MPFLTVQVTDSDSDKFSDGEYLDDDIEKGNAVMAAVTVVVIFLIFFLCMAIMLTWTLLVLGDHQVTKRSPEKFVFFVQISEMFRAGGSPFNSALTFLSGLTLCKLKKAGEKIFLLITIFFLKKNFYLILFLRDNEITIKLHVRCDPKIFNYGFSLEIQCPCFSPSHSPLLNSSLSPHWKPPIPKITRSGVVQ